MQRLGITINAHFDSAHFLPHYSGKCHNMHGHRWLVRVTLASRDGTLITGPYQGMLMDFGIAKAMLNDLCNFLDHHIINEVATQLRLEVPNSEQLLANPTAENMAIWFYTILQKRLQRHGEALQLVKVRIYESPDAYAEYGEL